MKKLMLFAFILAGTTIMAQEARFGIKGGLNYGATGGYETMRADLPSSFEESDKNAGFHIGGYGKFGILGIFIQPELMYTRLNTEYSSFDYKLDKIDAPILVGANVLGPLNIKAGPSFQYILNSKIDNANLKIQEIDKDITVGYQLGVGVNLGRLGFDLRYEGAFTENTAFGLNETASEHFEIDARPSQWILSVSLGL